MNRIDRSTQKVLPFSLAVGYVVLAALDAIYTTFLLPLLYGNTLHMADLMSLVHVGAAVLFLLCTLDRTSSYLKPKLFTWGVTAYTFACLLYDLNMVVYLRSFPYFYYLRYISSLLCGIMLVVVTIFLFTGKYHRHLFIGFYVFGGMKIVFDFLLRVLNVINYFSLQQLLVHSLYFIWTVLPIVIISFTLLTGCYLPPEMRLRQLMSKRTAGKLDEASYQEQRAEVIRNL